MSTDKRNSNWITPAVICVVVLGCAAALYIGFQDEPNEGPNTPEPYSSKHVDDGGPHTEEFLEYSKSVNLDEFDGTWELGLVVHDFGGGDGIKAKTAKGTAVLYSSCYNNVPPSSYVSTTVEVGDLIVFDQEGEDYNICDGEVFVIKTEKELEDGD